MLKGNFKLNLNTFCNINILQVSKLRKIAASAMEKIGSLDPADLPAEFQPVIKFVHRVTKLFNDIRSDVMGFVYVRIQH